MSRRTWPGLMLDPLRADRRRFHPRLESLEDRITPALAVTELADGLSAQAMVQSILGGGVQVSNIKYTGVPIAAGTFTGGAGIIGPDSGIVLTTGNARTLVVGPNKAGDTGEDNGAPGDPDLAALVPQGQTFNASILEFDFVPQGNNLRFKYVFGSEEYNEFVNSKFNDVFAFFVNGVNIAKVPGTNQPVSVNTVNGGNPLGTNATNPQFFVNNSPPSGQPAPFDTELDGFTRVLPALATVKAGQVNHIKIAIADTGDGILDSAVFIQAGTFFSGKPTHLLATGADAGGGPHVKVYNGDGSLRFNFYAYDPSFRGGVRVATGDVNGDGIDDIITAPGPGGGPNVKAFDGATGGLITSFFAYDEQFSGGVYVAVGEVSGTGTGDIITGAGPGGRPHVRIFNTDLGFNVGSFYAYDPSIRSGVRVAAGDLFGDGKTEVVTAPGPGFYPQVKVFDPSQISTPVPTPDAPGGVPIRFIDNKMPGEILSFMAYDPAFMGGVSVAVGDTDGDGKAEIVTGADAGGGPEVAVFDGATGTLRSASFPLPSDFSGGVRVGTFDLNGDGKAEVLAAPGVGLPPVVQVLDGTTLTPDSSFLAYDPAFTAGLFVS